MIGQADLTATEVARFNEQGFLALDSFVDDDTLATLRDLYDRILRGDLDMGPDFRMLGGITRQVMYPAEHLAYFADNPAVRQATEVAGQLLPGDPAPGFFFDMLICKPPGHPHETPWHQDWAYSQQPSAPAGTPAPLDMLSFWVALDDADEENGCMQFVRGAHRELREHHVTSGDPAGESRLLATDQVAPGEAIACPIPAGGCTIHTDGTPHYTGPNRSTDRPRRAYIISVKRGAHGRFSVGDPSAGDPGL